MEVRTNPNAPQTPLQLLAKATYGKRQYSDASDPRSVAFDERAIPSTLVVRPAGEETGPDGFAYQKYTPGVLVPNWDGGFNELGKGGDWRENVKRASKDASVAFRWLSMSFNLAGFTVSSVAQNDFRKDIKSAREKLDRSNSEMEKIYREAEKISGQIAERAGVLDGTRAELGSILETLREQQLSIELMSRSLDSLLSQLSVADSLVQKAKEQQAFANNRANFPAGIAGAEAQKKARISANEAMASAKKSYDTIFAEAGKQYNQIELAVGEYNEGKVEGDGVADEILSTQNEILSLEKRLYDQLRLMDGPLRQRAESITDMQKAQQVYAEKLKTGFALTQTATGLSGVEEALSHISAGCYYQGAGSFISGAYGATSPYLGVPEILPYTVLIRKAIETGSRTLEQGGDFRDFAMDFGELTVGVQSASNMIANLVRADDMMNEPGREYEAWNLIVDSTGQGVDILGKIATTGAVFFPPGVPAGPFIKPATVVARETLTGIAQEAVSLSYLESQGRLLSAPLGSGMVSGPALVLFGPIAFLLGVGGSVTGGQNTAGNIRAMADTGVPQLAPFRPISENAVTLRPTIPNAPANQVFDKAVSSGENIDAWIPVTGEPGP